MSKTPMPQLPTLAAFAFTISETIGQRIDAEIKAQQTVLAALIAVSGMDNAPSAAQSKRDRAIIEQQVKDKGVLNALLATYDKIEELNALARRVYQECNALHAWSKANRPKTSP